MFKKKNKQIKTLSNKSNLDQVLWFIENYLPQKKDRDVQKKLYMDNLEIETIKKFSKLASMRSKTLFPTTKTVSYTHLRAHETEADLVCRLLLEKKKSVH